MKCVINQKNEKIFEESGVPNINRENNAEYEEH